MTLELLAVAPLGWVVRHQPWDAPPSRRFAAVRATGDYRWLLGQPVVEEFGTLSSPIFLAPIPLLGKVYDAGLALALRRGAEMELDAGWPPLVAGYAAPAVEPPADWEERLRRALAAPLGPDAPSTTPQPGGTPASDADGRDPRSSTATAGAARPAVVAVGAPAPIVRRARFDAGELVGLRLGEVAVLATDAPLLPRQLVRLAEAADAPCAIAYTTGHELSRHAEGTLLDLRMLSESRLAPFLGAARELARPA